MKDAAFATLFGATAAAAAGAPAVVPLVGPGRY